MLESIVFDHFGIAGSRNQRDEAAWRGAARGRCRPDPLLATRRISEDAGFICKPAQSSSTRKPGAMAGSLRHRNHSPPEAADQSSSIMIFPATGRPNA